MLYQYVKNGGLLNISNRYGKNDMEVEDISEYINLIS